MSQISPFSKEPYTVGPVLIMSLSMRCDVLFRFVMRCLETRLFPNDVTRALIDWRRARRRGEDMLVSWSQTTSASSVFRYCCSVC